jgi:stress response protein YsnF
MLSQHEASAAVGSTAYGADGDRIGTVESFFADDRTGEPSWVAVSTGLFGTRHSIVPAIDATFTDGILRLPVRAAEVTTAPLVAGDHLDPEQEERLRRHYGIGTTTTTDTPDRAAVPDTDGSMTRSEEQLRVATDRVPATRVRLVKYVVTEEVQIAVPIRREEIRVEEVPLDAADEPGESLVPAGRSSARSGGLPSEIVLHTERPVVTVEVVPTERVRLRTELVEGQEKVTGQVQREQIVVDEDRRTP